MKMPIALCLVVLALTKIAYSEDKIPLAVIELEGQGVTESGVKEGVVDRVRYALSKTGRYIITSQKVTEAALKEQSLQRSGRCDDLACIVEIGKIVDAKKVVAGKVVKSGDLYQIALKLIDVQSARVENERVDSCKCDEEGLLQMAEEQAFILAGVKYRHSPVHPEDLDEELNRSLISAELERAEQLIKQGADVNLKISGEGWIPDATPLIAFAKGGNAKMVRLVLDKGADIKARDSNGWDALRWAIIGSIDTPKGQHAEVVKLLLDKGADVNAKDKFGSVTLGYALQSSKEVQEVLLKRTRRTTGGCVGPTRYIRLQPLSPARYQPPR